MSNEQSIRDQLIKAMYNAPTTGNVVVRYSDAADAILASPVIRRIQAEAWDACDESITDLLAREGDLSATLYNAWPKNPYREEQS